MRHSSPSASKLAALATLVALAAAAPARGETVEGTSCVGIPTESPAVTVCETASSYTFDLVGDKVAYEKAAYRTAARTAVTHWFASHGVTPPTGATLELWVAVPETDPHAAQGRFVLRAPLGASEQLVAFVGLNPDSFSLDDAHVGVLGSATYPSSFGHRASSLVVRPAAGASDADVAALLATYGATPVSGVEPEATYVSYQVPVFAEERTAKAAMADARASTVLAGVELNSFFEWIATRERAFAFSLEGP